MTYSIVARDVDSGAIGIAVASRFFACGALVPYVGRRSAIASQAFCNPVWGTEGRIRLDAGESAESVLADLIERDAAAGLRQCHMIDSDNAFAAHTGDDCTDWAGHEISGDFSVAGNMLAGPEVITATAEAMRDHSALPFAERLLAAMKAGEAAGGDSRGRQAAALIIHRGEAHPWIDLRVDDHGDPLAELERLFSVAREHYLVFAEAMATARDFSGLTDRKILDERLKKHQEQRRKQGRASRSHATGF